MACFYEMNELGLPFEKKSLNTSEVEPTGADVEEAEQSTRTFYTLRVCKDCRATWMESIQAWFRKDLEEKYPTEPTGEADIPVRINGSVRFLTKEQYYSERRHHE